MSTGDTVLFWVTCGIFGYTVCMGLFNLYRACQIWRQIRTRRLARRPPPQEGRR